MKYKIIIRAKEKAPKTPGNESAIRAFIDNLADKYEYLLKKCIFADYQYILNAGKENKAALGLWVCGSMGLWVG
ncbi:hypothetical protein ACFL57_05155, partial [Candidatus Margulisiibacteriota bacterium]